MVAPPGSFMTAFAMPFRWPWLEVVGACAAAGDAAPAARPRSEEPGVRGVPLGSLAACVSDRLEDALKQKVVAAVRDRAHCQSPAGTPS